MHSTRPRHEMTDLKHIKTRETLEASCACGWMLVAPEKERSMAQSNYDLHFARFCAERA